MPFTERLTPRSLRSRIWRPRCRYRSVARWVTKTISVFLLCLSVLVLVGYRVLTDPDLLRSRAIAYLERATGGNVTIGRASVSLIDGIEFDDVTLCPYGSTKPIFHASSLHMVSTLWTLLTRPYSEMRIMAIEPELSLVEDSVTGRWNFQQLGTAMSRDWSSGAARPTGSIVALPQITMRDAKIYRYSLANEKFELLGMLSIEGQFSPQSADGNYSYQLSTRSRQGEIGPSLSGDIALQHGRVTGRIEHFELAQALPLGPQRVAKFVDRLKPRGEIGADISIYRDANGESAFDVTLNLADASLTLDPDDLFSHTKDKVDPSADLAPVNLSDGQGTFVFTKNHIDISITGLIDTTTVKLAASIEGYDLDAPLKATVTTRGEPLALRLSKEQASRLPDFIGNLYNMYRPQGECHIDATVWRDTPGGRFDAIGSANFTDTEFTFENFPYPVHDAKGSVRLALNPTTGERELILDHITGRGPPDSVNAGANVEINGIMAPLAEGAGIDITIKGQNARGDALLVKCLPEDAQRVIGQFGPLGDDSFLQFSGDFETRVIRPRGFNVKWSFDTDIYLKQGRAFFKPLKVDIESARADIFVRNGSVDFRNVIATSHGAQATLDGRSLFRDPDYPDHATVTRINFKAEQIAADGPHRAILPQAAQDILKNLGVAGTVSLSGPITIVGDGEQVDYDFDLHLADGSLAPEGRPIRFDQLTADVRVQPAKTELKSISAARGESTLVASGVIQHPDSKLSYNVSGSLTNLEVDPDVVNSIDTEQRAKVVMLKPVGKIDLRFQYAQIDSKPTWIFDVVPKSLKIMPDFCPVPFDLLSGEARITDGAVDLKDVVAQTGETNLTIKGSLKADQYMLSGRASNVSIDSDFVRALPESLSQITRTSARGNLDIELRSIDWQADRAMEPPTTSLTIDAVATLRGVSMDLGVSIAELSGVVPVVVHTQNGKLTSIQGDLTAPTLLVAGLSAVDGKVKFASTDSAQRIVLSEIGFKLGGGEAAGSVTLDRSVENAVKYAGEMLLREAEIKQLAADSADIDGRLSASLTFDGIIGQSTARGRGDLSVTGRDMLKVPMLIGLTQVVSLSLPFTSGFDQAQASYVFDGGVVNFESVTLQSREMSIRGTGQMDFQSRTLDMTFYTDSNTRKLPVIGSVLDAARRELFQINIHGTLNEPTVKTGMLPTIGTTINEVLGED